MADGKPDRNDGQKCSEDAEDQLECRIEIHCNVTWCMVVALVRVDGDDYLL